MSGKWIIIIIIVLGVLSLILNQRGSDFRLNLAPPGTGRGTQLTQPVDSNRDGVVSPEESAAELRRVERELERVEEALAEARAAQHASPYKDQVTLEQGSARDSDYGDEYLTLRTSSRNPAPITITGWQLESPITGIKVRLKEGVRIPSGSYRQDTFSPIVLEPGMEAVVSTRGLPGFHSFRTNICTGYFNQSIRFTPRLPRDCPALEDENYAAHGITFSAFDEEDDYDACINAIERVPRCTKGVPRLDFIEPDDERQCRDFIRNYSTYERCVALHKNDFDFFGNEWRIFIGSGEDLWRDKREVIKLLDQNGKTVDVVSYD